MMRSATFLLFLFCMTDTGFAISADQDNPLSRWSKALSDASVSDADKVYFADSILVFYVKSNPDSAIYFSRVTLYYALKANDTASIDYATMYLGSLHRKKGNYDSSLYYYDKCLVSYTERNYEEGIASVYNNIATVYTEQSRYDLAIKKYYEALEVFKNSTNYNACANVYSNFAELYFKLENYDKAFEYWTNAKEFYIKGNDANEITNSIRGLAKVYLQRDNLPLAESQLLNALELDRKNEIDVFEVDDQLLLMELYLKTGDKKSFENSLSSIQPFMLVIDIPLKKASYHELFADYQLTQEKFKEAISIYDSSLFFLDEEDVPEMSLRILKKQFKAKILAGITNNMLADLNEIEELEIRVGTIRKDRITQELDAGYNLKEKEELISVLNEKNKTAQELVEKERELKKQKQQQNVLLWIGIIAICLFVVYGIFTYRKLRKTKRELEISMEEKDMLFKELNHRVKNNLAIVNSFLGIEMHGKSDEVKEILKICEGRIHSLGLMHEMLYQSEMIEKVELKSYFEKLVQFVSKTLVNNPTSMHINCQEEIWVSSNKVVLIGLITNELLTNAMKYAKDPSRNLRIDITVSRIENQLKIEISDNGIGLKADFNPQKSNSLGMKLAYGLTKQLNGTFSFKNLEQGSSFAILFEHQ